MGITTQFGFWLNTLGAIKKIHALVFVVALAFTPVQLTCQTKSTNIQTIDGRKFYIHKIEKSQSLYAISKLYNVGLDELYTHNPDLKNGAKANQEIKIPAFNLPATTATSTVPAVDTAHYTVHRVTKGETLYSICKKFNTSEKILSTYNPTLAEGIKEGQLLILGEKNSKKKTAPVAGKENKTGAPVVAREQKESKSTVIVKDIKPNTPLVDSSAFKPVSKPKKTSYNIALILPLRLESTTALDLSELVKTNGNFPAIPGLAIDFYLGFKRAMDSLAGKEFDLHLEVYDIDDKDSLKIVELASSPALKDLDFMFGPFYASGFKPIAKKARELHIPIVSPIIRENKILYNNIYVSKTNPSQFTLLENLADYCIDSLKTPGTNIILMSLNDKDKKEAQFVSAFRKHYSEKLKQSGRSAKDSVILAKGVAGLKTAFSASAKNVVVTLSNNQVQVIDFITQLSMLSEKKDVVLCSWESLGNMDNIDQDYLNRLNYTFPYQYNLTNTDAYKPLHDYYKTQQETLPGEYFYIGFDIAYYYFKHLRDNGPDFVHSLNTLPMETGYMNFKFTRPDNATGFDNRGVYIFKYNNYQLQKTGWK